MPADRPSAAASVAVLIGALLVQGCASSGQVVSPDVGPTIFTAALEALANRGAHLDAARLEEYSLYGGPGDRTYLGRLCFWTWNPDSVANSHGRFGSTSANGILNRSGRFGHPDSNYSPCNRRATSPPVVLTSSGVSLGRLTVNTDLPDAVQMPSLQAWIADACAGRSRTQGVETWNAGHGSTPDQAPGSHSARQAAQAVDARGEVRLGRVNFASRGVPPDDGQAVMRLLSQAEQGATLAQYDLGSRYADGRGVPLNLGEAYVWATVAATLSVGDERQKCIELRDRLAARMTPAHIAEAQNRARGWLAEFETRKK
jgi:hypothetical protein